MLFAASFRVTASRAFFLLHILAVIVAFAPMFELPTLRRRFRALGEEVPRSVLAVKAKNSSQIHGPALVAVAVFGMGTLALTSGASGFRNAWVAMALVLWAVMLVVVFAVLTPAERRAAAGDGRAEARIPALVGVMHVLLIVMLVLMIWQPGR